MADLRDFHLRAILGAAEARQKGAALGVFRALVEAVRRGDLTDFERDVLAGVLGGLTAIDHARAAELLGCPYQGRPKEIIQWVEIHGAVEEWLFDEKLAGRRGSKQAAYRAVAKSRRFLRADGRNAAGTPYSARQIKDIHLEVSRWHAEADFPL